jgi:penicillin-binding protein 1A
MILLAAISMAISGRKVLGKIIFFVLLILSIAVGALMGLFIVYKSDLPEVQSLEDYRPNVITELYSDDGQIIGSFALQRRIVLFYDQIPQLMRDAIIATEDRRFEKHWGVDFFGVARATAKALFNWRRIQGTSTITQQLSRVCFLTNERSFKRKFQELLFTLQIERFYTKAQILTLYCNQVYLGHGTYGFEAAAQFYFSKPLKELKLPEVALLAGLPATIHLYSPIERPDRARSRRDHVIDRIVVERKISREEGEAAKATDLGLRISGRQNALAPYFVEEIRRYLERKYGTEAVHEKGLRVYTTLNVEMQQAANQALLRGLEAYDRRHGWRGVQTNILKQKLATLDGYEHKDWKRPPLPENRMIGLITSVKPREARARLGEYEALVTDQSIAWTGKRYPGQILERGDLVFLKILSVDPVKKLAKVELDQRPLAQGALVAIESATGEVKAMVGGYDFDASKFNRATQALRQTGSAFKPFIYTLAMDQGMSPNDTIADTPVSYPSGQGIWSPQNYDHRFEGTITLRRALAQSRNVPAVKLLSHFGVEKGIEYVKRFGVTSPTLTPYLPLALGSAEITLLEMTSAYTVFPNDGVRILPRFIRMVTNYNGEVQEENQVEVREVIPQQTARTMVQLLRGVVEFGTAQQAKALKRPVAGKTGTTNDFTDAWFMGFTPHLTCGVWIGFDQKKTLGKAETGAKAALPVWIDFMQHVLGGTPPEDFTGVTLPGREPAEKVDTADEAAGDGETPPE